MGNGQWLEVVEVSDTFLFWDRKYTHVPLSGGGIF